MICRRQFKLIDKWKIWQSLALHGMHGQAIQTLGESISEVNGILSELKLVHQNTLSKIEQSYVESLCVTSDECISQANMHVSRCNTSTTLNNNTIVQ